MNSILTNLQNDIFIDTFDLLFYFLPFDFSFFMYLMYVLMVLVI